MNRGSRGGIKGKYTIAGFLLFTGMIQLFSSLPTFIRVWRVDKEAAGIMSVFVIPGVVLVFAGAMIILLDIRKKQVAKKVMKDGNYVLAEVIEVMDDYSNRINGRPSFVVKCQYVDSIGTVHIFKSDNLEMNPSVYLNSQLVKVYVNEDNFDNYHVDIEGSMQNIQYH